jgi:serine protease Do
MSTPLPLALWSQRLLALAVAIAITAPIAARAQELNGTQAALAVQQGLVQVIAKGERSVVAIARVKSGAGGGDDLAGGPEFNPFGGRRQLLGPGASADPTSPDFIPSRFGTGVIVDKNGLILTNYHVIDEDFLSSDSEITAQTPGEIYVWAMSWKTDPPKPGVYPARVKAADPRSDLAILQIKAEDLEAIKFAPTKDAERELKKGQIVVSLGNPYAIARDGSPSAAWGIIANVARKLGPQVDAPPTQSPKPTLQHCGSLIQTDARLNLGTSGGALLNLKGEMIGLTTAAAAVSGFEQAAGYAIPVDDTFRRVVETLMQGKEVEYGFLGVTPRNLTLEERQQGLQGMVIAGVKEGTPAFGKLDNQDVVVAVNGKPIFDADGLVLNVGKLPVGEVVRLTLMGGKREVEVPLSKYPVRGRRIVTSPVAAWRGLRVDYPTAVESLIVNQPNRSQWRALLEGCVVIVDVSPDSPAADARMQRWMLVTHVDNVRVQTPAQFRDAVAGKKGAVKLRLGSEGEEIVKTIAPQ